MGSILPWAARPVGEGELVDVLFWVPVLIITMIAVGGVLAAYYFGEVRRKQSR